MNRKPPPRLDPSNYIGLRAYFLTICTDQRLPVFTDSDVVEFALLQLLQCSSRYEIAVPACCFRPDHVHLLVRGETDRADLQEFVRVWKQCTGFHVKREHGIRLWQRGYYAHVLRSGESAEQKARYILENPVRAGLAVSPEDYRWIGSFTTTVQDLFERCRDDEGPT